MRLMLNNVLSDHHSSGIEMWQEYAMNYGVIPARVLCHHYLNQNAHNPHEGEQLFCDHLRKGMSMGLNTLSTPIYLWNDRFAELSGETKIYNDSMKAFEQCAEHIDQAIHTSVFGDGNEDVHFDLALAAVIDHHGLERVEIALKCAVLHDLTGKYPSDLRDWAQDFKKPDHFGNFGIRTRPATLAGLITEVRRQEAMLKMEKHKTPELQEVKPLIQFIDSDYRELFKIPDGEKIRITYPISDGREPVERSCKFHGEHHFHLEKNEILHICQFAEKMERVGARYEPVNQLLSIQPVPFTPGVGEDKFYSPNREEGNTCTGSLHGNFGNNSDGDRFSTSWREADNGLYNGEIQSEFQSVVYALRQDLLKNRDSMLAYCQSHPEAKLSDGKDYATYGFKLETESRQYFVNCFTQGRDSRFSVFAYADKPALTLGKEQGRVVVGAVLPGAVDDMKMFYRSDEVGTRLIGYMRGDFGKDGKEFWHNWFDGDIKRNTPEFKAEFQAVVDTLRQGIFKDYKSSLDYCRSNEDAKIADGNDCYFGFKLETESRQYFVRCTTNHDSYFYVFAYDKAAPVLENDKPSVLKEIRESRSAPKAPAKSKPERDKTKKKNQQEH